MEDIKSGYRSLERALQEDLDLIEAALDGDLLWKYREILLDEVEMLQKNLKRFDNNI